MQSVECPSFGVGKEKNRFPWLPDIVHHIGLLPWPVNSKERLWEKKFTHNSRDRPWTLLGIYQYQIINSSNIGILPHVIRKNNGCDENLFTIDS